MKRKLTANGGVITERGPRSSRKTKVKRSKRIDTTERTRARQTGASVRKLRKEQRAAEAQAQEQSGSHKCGCGCGAQVTRRFKPGHDMRMHPGSKWLKQHPELATTKKEKL